MEIELPNTKPVLMIEGGCVNKLNFEENTFELSTITSGTWKYLNGNEDEIKENSNKYSGIYNIKRKFANDVLQLKSKKITIKLKRNIHSSNKIIFNIE